MNTDIQRIALFAASTSTRLSWIVERVCVVLMVLLILDVWLGVVSRYLINLPITFTEEAARYLMIWMALLAVSVGISRREHIGVEFLFDMLPKGMRRWILLLIDIIALGFFLILFIYGIDMVVRGTKSYTMIFGLNKALPFAAVPVASFICCLQLCLVAIRDQFYFEINVSDERGA